MFVQVKETEEKEEKENDDEFTEPKEGTSKSGGGFQVKELKKQDVTRGLVLPENGRSMVLFQLSCSAVLS